jgi:glycosyltransferase involved in cell wall biosynthesis
MRISFYAPFKPLGHKDPSGDLVIGTGLYQYLKKQGHSVEIASSLRSRWIYWKPWLIPRVLIERRRLTRRCRLNNIDLWFTYHTYYKGPDLLGPSVASYAKIPYVIFQGVYSTKRKKKIKTRPGFVLNTKALLAARHVFTNKRGDYTNLIRLLPDKRVTYVAPGIYPEEFRFDQEARRVLRREWQVGDTPVLLSAAMFRADVKTESLTWLMESCGRVMQNGRSFYLVIAGDGKEKPRLQNLAETFLPGRVRFVGKVPREKMYRFYSAGDIFVYPGIGESLGMVFLEAQSCSLPVVAFDNAGVPEVVKNQVTGLLRPKHAFEPYAEAVDRLLISRDLRLKMGQAARAYICKEHDLAKNYRIVDDVLHQVAGKNSNR